MAAVTHSYYPPDLLPQPFCVSRGANDLLFTEDGKPYIDLLSGSGTAFLGHANPAIARTLKEQLDALWNTGAVPTRLGSEAGAAVEEFFPPSHRLAMLYSTGMEAVEFALRVARQVTGRRGVVGFDGCMHGKSMATAALGWANELVTLPDFRRLPYLPERSEEVILEHVRSALATHSVSAVVLEPLLGSRGGYIPSRQFVEQVSTLCVEHGSLFVMDEIFTGFYRTGPAFLHQALGVAPDIVLIGKAMGNGFPVSGVVVDRRYPIDASMLPGSTFAGNPLAASAVLATLREMRANNLPEKVAKIEGTILNALSGLGELGVALRGKGALWILDLPRSMPVSAVMSHILRSGVIVSQTASFIRLLPAATISLAHLTDACRVIGEACQAQSRTGR